MAKSFYPPNDAEFAIWFANLINKAGTNKTILKVADEKLTTLDTKLTAFNESLALKQQKKDEAIAQTTLVSNLRKELNKEVGLLNNGFKGIDGLPPNILEELGLKVNEGSAVNSPPAAPADLVVTGASDGVNALKWNRSGNRQGTTFIIEARIGGSENWGIIDAVTGSNYKHKNQTPGVTAHYRVKAKRGELESGFSNTAVVYG
ncbi:MAG TPA: fibronectin type III domain-containing protein [Pyrinomonadaceae bacterium]